MATTDIIARLKLNAANFSTELNKELGGVERKFGQTGNVIGRNLSAGIGGGLQQAAAQVPVLGSALTGLSGPALVAAGGIGLIAAAMAAGVGEAENYQNALRGMNAVLDATGNKTGLARQELVAFAEGLEGKFAIPAEEILKAETALSSFDGVAGTTFKRSIELAGDMSAVFGGDLAGNAQKLGTVLQNLAGGDVEGLGRAFKFLGTETLDAVGELAKAGKTEDAQGALLKALEQRLGGSGEAGGKGVSGAWFRLSDAISDANREFVTGTGIYAAVERGINGIADAINNIDFSKVSAISDAQRMRLGLPAAPREPSGGERMAAAPAISRAGLDYASEAVAARGAADGAKREGDARRAREAAEALAEKRAREREAAGRRAAAEGVRAAKETAAANEALERTLKQAASTADAAVDALASARRAATADVPDLQRRFGVDVDRDMDRIIGQLDERQRRQFNDRVGVRDAAGGFTGRITDSAAEVEKMMERAGRAGGEAFRSSGVEGAQAIAQVLGGKVGRSLAGVLGAVDGARTGNFNSVGGPVGGVLTLLSGSGGAGKGSAFQKGLSEVFDPLKDSFDKLGGKLGLGAGAGPALGKAAGFAGLGAASASLAGAIGIGGGNSALGSLGGLAGGMIGGPLGSIVGGVAGSIASKLFKESKAGEATITSLTGSPTLTGDSRKLQGVATGLAGQVTESLRRIQEALGGTAGAFAVTIGQRDDSFRVDPTGRGLTKTKNGGIDFASAEEAVRFAVADALQDGAVRGISDAAQRILASGQDLEAAITKAVFIEGLPRQLKAMTDPLGAAIDELNDRWREQIAILDEAGASAEQMADAQKLYGLQLDQVKASVRGAADTLRGLQADLNFGTASPLSLRAQQASARLDLEPFLGAIDRGERIDQEKYAAAARAALDVERQLSGSTGDFFALFDRVQSYTGRAIAEIDKAEPIRSISDPFNERTAKAAEATAGMTQDANDILREMRNLLAGMGGGATDAFIGGTRSFG